VVGVLQVSWYSRYYKVEGFCLDNKNDMCGDDQLEGL
jgi:hypothetical protein